MDLIIPKYFFIMLLLWIILVLVMNNKFKELHDEEQESQYLRKFNKRIQNILQQVEEIPTNIKKWTQLSSQYKDNRWKNAKCASCEYTDNVTEADFVFAHPHKTIIDRQFKSQKWIGQFWESEGKYPSINDKPFDFTRSYRADATFSYYNMMTDTFKPNNIAEVVPYKDKKKKKQIMSSWISNCDFLEGARKRMRMLKRLEKKGVSYASYGKCDRDHNTGEILPYANRQIQKWDTDKTKNWAQSGSQKMAHASQYLFMFAAENDNSPYYHTEKIFYALMCGSVPIYWGHKTIYEYIPEHSMIFADDYGDNLANYILKVAENETLYNSYLAWRSKPLPAKMLEKVNYSPPSECDICNFLIKS